MDEAFWQRRWARNEIGFHLNEVNPYLQRYWSAISAAGRAKVLVPLCGKTLDMVWLAEQGFTVIGVELSEKAAVEFFAEQGLAPGVNVQGAFKVYRAGAMEIRCGDFFALRREDVADCQLLYDRAALIALPVKMRARYVAHLASIMTPGCRGLLVTLDYEQGQMDGPPFAVGDVEVQQSMGSDWRIAMLECTDVLNGNWKFLERGLTRLEERCYRIERI